MKNRTIYIREPKDSKHSFSVTSNNIIFDLELTMLEKGIMTCILAKKDTWVVNKSQVFEESKMGETVFNKAWKTLMKRGFIELKRLAGSVEWTIREYPTPKEVKKEASKTKTLKSKQTTKGKKKTPLKVVKQVDLQKIEDQEVEFEIKEAFPAGETYPKKKVILKLGKIINSYGLKGWTEIQLLKEIYEIKEHKSYQNGEKYETLSVRERVLS